MLRERGAHVLGEALDARRRCRRATRREAIVTDGPFAETKEARRWLLRRRCASRDEAIELAGRVPQSPGVAVEVLAIADI